MNNTEFTTLRYVRVFTPMILNSAAATHIMKTSCSMDVYRFLLKLGLGSTHRSGKTQHSSCFTMRNWIHWKSYTTRVNLFTVWKERKNVRATEGLSSISFVVTFVLKGGLMFLLDRGVECPIYYPVACSSTSMTMTLHHVWNGSKWTLFVY